MSELPNPAVQWVVLTGGYGFVGRHVALGLREQGYRIVALLRNGDQDNRNIGDALFERCDRLSDLYSLTKKDGPPLAIIHLATAYGYDGKFGDVIESNLLLPSRLLDFCIESGCRHFINTDTFFAKPELSYPYLQAYIQSKREFIRWINLACISNKNLRISSMRLEHVYGGGDKPQKFVSDLISRLVRHEPLIKLTPGDQIRDFIHVSDVVRAYICVIKHEEKISAGMTEYEVGTGLGISLRSFVETAKKIIDSKSTLLFGALSHRTNEIMCSIADTSQLEELGWKSTLTLEEGLMETIKSHVPLTILEK